MKKILLILALALATALPAMAENFSPDGKWSELPEEGGAGLPFDFDEIWSASQAIYSYEQLKDIAPSRDSKGATVTCNLNKVMLPFCIPNGLYGTSGQLEFEVYIDNIGEYSFPKINNKPQWLSYGNGAKGTLIIDGSELYDLVSTNTTVEVAVDLKSVSDKPFVYTGQALLVTIFANNTIEDMIDDWWFDGSVNYTPGNAANPSSGFKCGATKPTLIGDMSGTSTSIPVINFGYTTITEAAEGTPVTLENIALAVEDYKADPALGQGSSVSNIAIRFDVNDPTNCGEYEIKVDDNSIGSVHSTSGTINFLGMPKQDVKLSVIPKGEGTTATDKTIDISEFEALFPNPEVSVVRTALYGSYEVLTARSVVLEGAAQFKLTTPIKSAIFMPSGSNDAKLMTTDGSYPESLEALVPENATYTDWKYVGLNDGLISYYKQNAFSLSVDKGVIKDFDKSATITVKFAVDYPVVSGTPVLVEGRGEYVADGDYAVAGAGFSFTNVNRVYDNGSSYNPSELSARLNAAEEGVLTLDLEYPRNFTSEINNDKSVTFYAPAGHTIWYAFVPNTTVATFALDDTLEWQQAETNPFTVSFADLGSGTIHAKAVKESGEETEVHSYNINNDGEISGIESVEVDGDAAVEYFNLQGVRVGTPQSGLFIRRQGNKAAKVYVK